MSEPFSDDLMTEVVNDAAEYMHDIGRCLEDCPFCEAGEEDD